MCVLVMPGLVGVAGFHRRDDMHQAGTVATDDKQPGDDVLLADVVLGFLAMCSMVMPAALANSAAREAGETASPSPPAFYWLRGSSHDPVRRSYGEKLVTA